MNEKLSCVGGEVKHENFVSNELTRVKYPPEKENQAEVWRVSPVSEFSWL